MRDRSEVATYPRSINHVGVGVADIERAIHWYQEVLGFPPHGTCEGVC